jgi:hypothetical protein
MDLTSFDTHETRVYKLAVEWGVQVLMIIVLRPDTNQPEYINAEQVILSNLDKLELSSIETFLRVKSKKGWTTQVIEVTILALVQKLVNRNNPDEEIVPDLKQGIAVLEKAEKQRKSPAALIVRQYLDRINAFLFDQRSHKKRRMRDLAGEYASIMNTRTEALKRAQTVVAQITRVHQLYANVMANSPLKSSDLITVSEDVRYAMTTRNNEGLPLVAAIFSIFDSAALTRQVPHMICTDAEGVTYQKIYDPDPFEDPIDSKFLLNVHLSSLLASIVFTIVDGNHVYTVYWLLETGYAKVYGVKGVSRQKVDVVLNSIFPTIETETAENLITQYELRLYPIEPVAFILKEYILLHRLIVDPQVYQFYLNESTSPYPYKKSSELIFRYKPAWTANYYIEDEVVFTMGLGSTMSNTNSIVLNIESYSTIGVWRLLTAMIPAICLHFQEDLIQPGPYAALYALAGPIDPPRVRTKTRLHQLLFDEFPEVYTAAYLYGGSAKKKVHKRNLVRVTTDQQLANLWRQEVIETKNQVIPRSVGEFHDKAGKFLFWYTTVTPDTPYLRLLPNNREPNPVYTEVPGSSTAETESRKGKGETVSANILINSLTALNYGRRGVLPPAFDVILPGCERRGITRGPNSFLECVWYAKETPEGARSQKALERKRREIATKVNPWRLKQQFYDLDTPEITKELLRVTDYLDPALYIAALEEYFGIDIYVIVPTTVSNITTMKFLIPRHIKFYARNAVIRRCAIVFCHAGVQSDNLLYNHCELIVSKDYQEEYLRSVEVSARLRQIFHDTTHTEVLNPRHLYDVEFLNADLDHVLRNYTLVSQYIDGYGKLRAVTLQVGNQLVSVIMEPREPYNLDHSPKLTLTSYQQALDLGNVGKPLGRSTDGIWIRFQGTTSIVYFRLLEEDRDLPEFLVIPITGLDPLLVESESPSLVQNYAYKERDFIILTQLTKWMFEIFYTDTKQDAKTFMNTYFTAADTDEEEYYTTADTTQIIPAVADLQAAIQFTRRVIPFRRNKFVLHNATFLSKLSYLIDRYQRSVGLLSNAKTSRIIPGFYSSIFDFLPQPKTQIYTANTDVKDIASKGDIFAIVTTIVYDPDRRTPIAYQQAGKLYLIQNTILEDLSSALRVAVTWNAQGINLGYRPVPMDTLEEIEAYSFVIYKVWYGGLVCVYTHLIDGQPTALLIDYMVDVQEFEVHERKRTREGQTTMKDRTTRKRYAALLLL